MALKSRVTGVEVLTPPWPLPGPPCQCLAAFFREEFAKHRRCLDECREYFSEDAIRQADDVLTRVMEQVDQLCRRDDAGELVGALLRQLDAVTKLSAWTDPKHLH